MTATARRSVRFSCLREQKHSALLIRDSSGQVYGVLCRVSKGASGAAPSVRLASGRKARAVSPANLAAATTMLWTKTADNQVGYLSYWCRPVAAVA